MAFVVGKVCLGLRSDYLAISTLLVSGIIITIVKHEEWLSRGVKNVIGLKRPVPYEVDLQNSEWFIKLVEFFNSSKLSNILDPDEKISLLNFSYSFSSTSLDWRGGSFFSSQSF